MFVLGYVVLSDDQRLARRTIGEDSKKYKHAVRDCCLANGFQYVRVGERLDKINIKTMLNIKFYKIAIYITEQGAKYKISPCKN